VQPGGPQRKQAPSRDLSLFTNPPVPTHQAPIIRKGSHHHPRNHFYNLHPATNRTANYTQGRSEWHNQSKKREGTTKEEKEQAPLDRSLEIWIYPPHRLSLSIYTYTHELLFALKRTAQRIIVPGKHEHGHRHGQRGTYGGRAFSGVLQTPSTPFPFPFSTESIS